MKHSRIIFTLLFLFAIALASRTPADDAVVELRFENHRFIPQTITVPANQPLKIKITNAAKRPSNSKASNSTVRRSLGPVSR